MDLFALIAYSVIGLLAAITVYVYAITFLPKSHRLKELKMERKNVKLHVLFK